MLKQTIKLFIVVFAVFIVFSFFVYYFNSKNYFKVQKVIDGDSIILEDGREIRYLGVDSPELNHNGVKEECGAEEAKSFNQKILLGHRVRLVKDKEDKDLYGRLLRYVYTDNNIFVNKELIREGWGQIFVVFPNIRFGDQLFESQKRAKKENKGLWKNCFFKNSSSPIRDKKCLTGSETADYLGEEACVRYKVGSIFQSETGLGTIYLQDKKPSNFSAVIFPSALVNFKVDPSKYTDKEIEVWGIIRRYRDKPEIIINYEKDIGVID